MARGFESKDVEFQQAEAERRAGARRERPAAERQADAERKTIMLTLARVRADLAAAKSSAHRGMLEQSIAALEQKLAALGGGGSAD
jgi:hypothetical protein